MKCKKCKLDIPDGAKVCTHCGAKQGMGVGGAIVAVILIILAISAISNMVKGYNSAKDGTNSSTVSVPAMTREEFIESCSVVSFEDLSRNPDKYKGANLTFTGEVAQVIEPTYGTEVSLRINVTKGEIFWRDTIFATVDLPKDSDRILEDDIITIYGVCDGLYSYTSVLGEKISLPKINIVFFSMN